MTLRERREQTGYPSQTMRAAVDGELDGLEMLSESQKRTLRECYLQQISVESAAWKLKVDPLIVEMLYFRLSISLSRMALSAGRTDP
jgi:hypothetical protein